MRTNVRLFSEILYDELDKEAWGFIDPEHFCEIAEECPDGMEFKNDVPDRDDSEALAHVLYRALVRYEEAKRADKCDNCDKWGC